MNSEIYLHKHTRREFRERMAAGQLHACIIPVAAIEQHLEHMAMEHDWRSVNVIADGVARKLAPQVLVAQGVMVGISEHHMKHPGSMSLSPGTFVNVLSDLIDSVVRAGFTNVLVLNGHGGNIATSRAVWGQLLRKFQVNLQFLPYWEVLDVDDAQILATADIPGHAQEFETAFALAEFPENVRHNAMMEQEDNTPTFATPEAGRVLIERTIDRVSRIVSEMISGANKIDVPPFFP